MPAYNAEKYISDSIDSVLSQSYQNWELIVVDDASTDSTLGKINRVCQGDSRVVVFHNDENKGVAESRNIGLDIAKGDLIAFLDADDIWLPDKLKAQIDLLYRNPDACIVYTSYRRVNSNNEVIGFSDVPDRVDFEMLLKGNPICNSSAVLKASFLNGIRFKPIRHEDYLFWLRVLESHSGSHGIGLKSPLTLYRVHNASISSNKFMSALWHWRLLRDEIGISFPKAIINFIYYAYSGIKKRV